MAAEQGPAEDLRRQADGGADWEGWRAARAPGDPAGTGARIAFIFELAKREMGAKEREAERLAALDRGEGDSRRH